MTESQLIFDQFSRYKTAKDLLVHAGLTDETTILDAGSGPLCSFEELLHGYNCTFVDPLIETPSATRIKGDVFCDQLNGKLFSFSVAIDVYEHIPPDQRTGFLSRIQNLTEDAIILAFPSQEQPGALQTDEYVNEKYRQIYGQDYIWLDEHFEYGLPSRLEVIEEFEANGWFVQTIEQGRNSWLRDILPTVIALWDYPASHQTIMDMSKAFATAFAPHDFHSDCYRTYILASRRKIPLFEVPKLSKPKSEELDRRFDDFLQQFQIDMFECGLTVTVDERKRHENAIAELQKTQKDEIAKRDAATRALQQSQKQEIEKRDAQSRLLHQRNMDLSTKLDEAHKQLQAADVRIQNPSVKLLLKSLPRRVKGKLRRILSKSPVGTLYRFLKQSRHKYRHRRSVTELTQSVRSKDGNLIVAFPIINWDFRWQRPQQLLSRIAKHGHTILYPAMTITPKDSLYSSNQAALADIRLNQLGDAVFQVWLHSDGPLNIYTDTFSESDITNIELGIASVIEQTEANSVILLVQFPGWWPVAKRLKEKWGFNVVFDCMDNHAGFSTNTPNALSTEQDLIENSDLVIASSDDLLAMCGKRNDNCVLIKNGTEFDHFHNPTSNGIVPKIATGPVVGYYGAISDWFDVELVAFCARLRPSWHFVLIGATTGADISKLSEIENIHLLGEIPYPELPGYLADFDVCMIPFKIIPLTIATNPVKFYEYLSAGKPVVSTRLPELNQYREFCHLAKDKYQFLDQLDQAISHKLSPEEIAKMLDLAKHNSWDARVKSLLDQPLFKVTET